MKISRFASTSIGLSVCLVTMGLAQESSPAKRLARISWQELHDAHALTSGEFFLATETLPAHLRLEHSSAEPRLFALTEILAPPIEAESYVVRGRIRYQGVAADSYLEMWNHFPGGQAYFTRTLGQGGPMGRLTGTSDWRDFQLPFHKGPEPPPEKLVINLQLQGTGIVDISDLELVAAADGLFIDQVAGAWWSDSMGGIVGGSFGAFLGILLGGVIGPLAGLGRARGFVIATLYLCGIISTIAFVGGIVAVASGQPYGVYYPLLLGGGLGASFGFGSLPVCRQRYRDAELRRMTALDASSV